jgi:hypothetical protein
VRRLRWHKVDPLQRRFKRVGWSIIVSANIFRVVQKYQVLAAS